ncbi:thiamine-phosphate kinase [Alteromonas oceanisediminis]|uniref:thiamine-phosphate kinase n=1 Tax=Alteromonas oceanisediminis TaxID=2836180 RepID=UPI001BD988F6|nr:thiamine-phosphate kinase [Alteromonas oceanisediminis]MBT0585820.1 thiamine-phosphate kinase [Alteromonas oceanisediminis]
MKEFDLIDRFFKHGGHQRKDVIIGIGDDAAITQIPANQYLATTTDTLVSGVHFLPDSDPRAVAYKAVAVNLSDLAAMGAEPAWISLSLSIPDINQDWLASFTEGLYELTQYYSVQLIGGDTVSGPLALTITAQGFVPHDSALRRSGAKPGDWIYVTGTVGDAGAGLDILKGELEAEQAAADFLIKRHQYPSPQVVAGTALRRAASACIDVSDGVLGDLRHILHSSHCGALLHVDKLPLSEALRSSVSPQRAIEYALTAGDDYELLFTVAEDFKSQVETAFSSFNVNATCIGQVTGAVNKVELKLNNSPYRYEGAGGFEHFNAK